ncbi:MAG: hypothetical protein DSM106950_06790 [Stigonema ocellatum SAG 48.90 = DSM 106950]|nr:hypothetical protein [Stigonema ocellatum SAG 48.90 = DSM 106950]
MNMNKIVLAVLATTLSTASTVAFSQSAKADSPYDHRPGYSRQDYRNDRYRDDRHRDDRYRDDRYYSHRDYPRRYYEGRYYYPAPRSPLQLVVPVIIR